MITCTYDTTAIKTYIDGVLGLTTTTTTYGVAIPTGAYFFIGAESAGTTCTNRYTGKLSDVRIYHTTFSDDDVLKLYHGIE